MSGWIVQESQSERDYREGYETGEAIGRAVGSSCVCLGPLLFVVSLIVFLKKRTTGWKVAMILSGIMTFLLLLLLAAGFVVGIAEGLKESAGRGAPAVIESYDNRVRLTIPSGWYDIEDLHEDASVQVGNEWKDEYLIVLTDLKEDFDGGLTEHVDETVGAMLENIEKGEVLSREPAQVAGYEAVRVEMRGTVDRMRIVYLQTTIEVDDAFHQLLAWTLPSRREDAFGVFKKTVNSFEVVEE